MDTYRTEDEQVEALKKWWRENGRSTILGVVVAVALAGGWRFWQGWQDDQSSAASEIYHSLLEADARAPQQDAQRKTAVYLATQLREDFSRSGYAEFAALFLARYAAEDGNWEEAEAQLRWVIEQKPEAPLLAQARLRLAQVLSGAGRHDEALAQLAKVAQPGYEALAAEARGDILLARGDEAAALQAYTEAQAALSAAAARGGGNALLRMKIQQLRQSHDAGTEAEASSSQKATQ